MHPLTAAAVFFHELVNRRPLARAPEPEMLMEDRERVDAYADTARSGDGIMAAAALFHAGRASMVLGSSARVLDLGCGPAAQLARIARLHPDKRFCGAELSAPMLDSARRHLEALGLDNVELLRGDITRLTGVADASFDAVISTFALHHLPTLDDLRACLREARRVCKPNGALYLADFGRLRSDASVRRFARLRASSMPELLVRDYERSLRAAFTEEEHRTAVAEVFPARVRVLTTALVPFMVLIKTPDQWLASSKRAILRSERRVLSPVYRGDLDSLRAFFRLGGLEGDPFS